MTKQGAPPSEQNGEKGCFLLREASETPTTKNRVFPQTRQRETSFEVSDILHCKTTKTSARNINMSPQTRLFSCAATPC